MAGRILNRRELRKQADEAEARESPQDSDAADEDDEDEDTGDAGGDDDEGPGADTEGGADDEAPPLAKKPAKARKPRKPKAAPRMRARWGVFDASMKRVAIFDYNQRAAADEKAAELAAKKNGTFFLQMVKEPMPEPAPEGAPGPGAK